MALSHAEPRRGDVDTQVIGSDLQEPGVRWVQIKRQFVDLADRIGTSHSPAAERRYCKGAFIPLPVTSEAHLRWELSQAGQTS